MIFLLIFGMLILILAGFYLANSIQRYGTWKGPTVLVILSLLMTVYGGWGFIKERQAMNHPTAAQKASQSSSSQQTMNQSLDPSKVQQTTMASMDQNKNTKEQREMVVLRQMQKGYGKFGSVDFDAKTKSYNIEPTDDKTVQAFKALANDRSLAKQMGWNKLTDSVKENSKQISDEKVLGSGYQIQLINPANNQPLYTVKDGQPTYNIAGQQ